MTRRASVVSALGAAAIVLVVAMAATNRWLLLLRATSFFSIGVAAWVLRQSVGEAWRHRGWNHHFRYAGAWVMFAIGYILVVGEVLVALLLRVEQLEYSVDVGLYWVGLVLAALGLVGIVRERRAY